LSRRNEKRRRIRRKKGIWVFYLWPQGPAAAASGKIWFSPKSWSIHRRRPRRPLTFLAGSTGRRNERANGQRGAISALRDDNTIE
jgi:hypothetical protein